MKFVKYERILFQYFFCLRLKSVVCSLFKDIDLCFYVNNKGNGDTLSCFLLCEYPGEKLGLHVFLRANRIL